MKTKFICIKTYSSEPETYGIDFAAGVVYTGKKDRNDFYMHSLENGTDVLLSEGEVEEYFISVRDLWCEFGDVPLNPETECIEAPWRNFPEGTHREDIWHHFEEAFGVKVYDLMYS